MRADRVKPGMVVKDDEGVWQVVVGAARRERPYPIDRGHAISIVLDYATGMQEEVSQPDEDVEAVRLTAPQVEALRNVDAGHVRRSWRAGRRPQWKMRDHWQPLSAAPYGRLCDLGLIGQRGGIESVGLNHREHFEVSPSGRALLDLLDKEPTR